MPQSVQGPTTQRRVVVVGGGVAGCATAYQLAQAGFHVTLLERDRIGAHASGRSAGNLNPLHGTPRDLIPYTVHAFHLHTQIRKELADLGCAQADAAAVDRVHLGYDEGDRKQLEETVESCNLPGEFTASRVDVAELRRIEPRLADDMQFGVLTTGALSIDSYGFTRSLADGAKKLGAVIVYAAVSGFESSGGRVTAIRSGADSIPCDEVVFATGPWAGEANLWLGIDVPVFPVKGELLLVRLDGGPPAFDFTWRTACLYRRSGDEVWVGGTKTDSGFDATPTAEAREFLLEGAARIMPGIRQATVLNHIAALRPVPAANEPIAGRATGWENVYLANGGGAKGILLSVSMARTIRELIQTK